MTDEWVVGGTVFGLEDFEASGGVEGVGGESVDGFGGDRYESP